MSCDLKSCERPGPHYQGDAFDLLDGDWDLVIAHPPCTSVCLSGNQWYAGTPEREAGVRFVEQVWQAVKGPLCIENPLGVLTTMSDLLPKPQWIQPYEFGHGEKKKTGLWLRGLPPLIPTSKKEDFEEIKESCQMAGESKARAANRARTFPGIAKAMAEQWG